MFNFPANNPKLKIITQHYIQAQSMELLSEFLDNETIIKDDNQALTLCRQFQQLIDIAMADESEPPALAEIKDIENQLFSLFNLVYHAVLNLGFETQWQQAANEARTAQG